MLKRLFSDHRSPITDHLLACGLALLAVALLAAEASACPTCKEGLADNPHGQSMAAGYYYSILFMMSMPFIILTTFGSVCYRSVKRAQAERDAAANK
jgi:uncharacterized membrane protein